MLLVAKLHMHGKYCSVPCLHRCTSASASASRRLEGCTQLPAVSYGVLHILSYLVLILPYCGVLRTLLYLTECTSPLLSSPTQSSLPVQSTHHHFSLSLSLPLPDPPIHLTPTTTHSHPLHPIHLQSIPLPLLPLYHFSSLPPLLPLPPTTYTLTHLPPPTTHLTFPPPYPLLHTPPTPSSY